MTLAPDTDRIESQRLILRRIDHGDLEFFTRLHADPEVARYLLHGRPRSSQESLAWIQSIFGTYEDFATIRFKSEAYESRKSAANCNTPERQVSGGLNGTPNLRSWPDCASSRQIGRRTDRLGLCGGCCIDHGPPLDSPSPVTSPGCQLSRIADSL